MNRQLLPFLAASLLLATAVACADGGGPDPTAVPGGEPPISGTLTVFAASSLTDAFNDLAAEFEEINPRVDIQFNFAGSPTLRTQLEQGARADIYASADPKQMKLAKEHGIVSAAGQVFARNSLVVITPADNSGMIETAADLKTAGLKLVLAHPEVPAGGYSREVLAAMSDDPAYGAAFGDAVLDNVVSNESNVKQVVAKVELGEADGGIVYGSDVTPSVAPNLRTLEVPDEFNVIAEYPIAVTKEARNTRAAEAFIDFVLSSQGQAVLEKWGFLPVV